VLHRGAATPSKKGSASSTDYAAMSLIKKGSGVTETEKRLARLAEDSFLSLWCYPNLFRDQGQRNNGDGKELCDLLVVFGDDIIIFSDKSCAFPNKSPDLDWRRWFKKAVFEAAEQAYGAERWILRYPDRIFLDRKCTDRFPVPLPPPERRRVHRVVIALHAAERSRAFFGRGNGSLRLKPSLVGRSHYDLPFTIGQLDPTRGYVHVLDEFTFDVLMSEVDTASDFVEYLSKKERAIATGAFVEADGEEELVAYYTTHWGADGKHHLAPSADGAPMVVETKWNDLKSNAKYIAKKEADGASYHWDDLIEYIASIYNEGNIDPRYVPTFGDFEGALRFMASEPRLARRLYGGTYFAIRHHDTSTEPIVRIFRSYRNPNVGYVLLIFAVDDKGPFTAHDTRLVLLATCCSLAFMRYNLDHVVGVANDPLNVPNQKRSIDLIHTNHAKMTLDVRANALHMKKVFRISDFPDLSNNFVREYPEIVPLGPDLFFQPMDTYDN
jgi:hypothetical protein